MAGLRFSLRKIILLSFILCFLLVPSALAGTVTEDWADKNFDFTTVKTIMLEDLEIENIDANDIEEKNMLDYFYERAGKYSFEVVSADTVINNISLANGVDLNSLADTNPERAEAIWRADFPKNAQLRVAAKVMAYGTGSTYVPPHEELVFDNTAPAPFWGPAWRPGWGPALVPVLVPGYNFYFVNTKLRLDAYTLTDDGWQVVYSAESICTKRIGKGQAAFEKVVKECLGGLNAKIKG